MAIRIPAIAVLKLQNNMIGGEIPNNLYEIQHSLTIINLSNNKFQSTIDPIMDMLFEKPNQPWTNNGRPTTTPTEIYLHNNLFEGTINAGDNDIDRNLLSTNFRLVNFTLYQNERLQGTIGLQFMNVPNIVVDCTKIVCDVCQCG